MKLLIVDDSKVLSNLLSILISQIEDIQIIGQADNPSDAKESIETHQPDILLLDLQLNDGNGFEVIKFTKNHYPDTKILVLTNYPYTPYKEKCHSLGADYFLDKACEFRKVQNIIKSIISNEYNLKDCPVA